MKDFFKEKKEENHFFAVEIVCEFFKLSLGVSQE